MDDGSEDDSCSFVAQGTWQGVRLVRGQGLGASRARNLGAEAAAGDILVFLDAHVIPDPGWLEELVPLLREPTVGLAGLGVRNLEAPQAVGYTLFFKDEHLGMDWAGPLSPEPYESPCISGCCLAARRQVFREVGGFDPGTAKWGLEDMELSLRAWFLGYRCLVSPLRCVSHFFKGHNRNFAVTFEDFDFNLLRVVYTYFPPELSAAVVAGIRHRENFPRSLARLHADRAFWERRAELHARFRHNAAWYFSKFSVQFQAFQERIRELTKQNGAAMSKTYAPVVCPRCGGINLGDLTHCLLCQADLPRVPESPHRPPPECPGCGAALRANARFCGRCGMVISAPAPPEPASAPPPACPQCGRPLNPGARFCGGCGQQFG